MEFCAAPSLTRSESKSDDAFLLHRKIASIIHTLLDSVYLNTVLCAVVWGVDGHRINFG